MRALPPGIWALGLVSMFMDVSSELVHSLLPIFMVTVLGASMVTVGVIEGIAEATAAFTKVFSGAISDHFRKRKLLVVLGYGLGAIAKPLFPLAPTIGWVFTGRFLDRIGKGIRGAPRDALLADITPPQIRGAAYGLRQALDTVGAIAGPLVAIALMIAWNDDYRAVFWVAVLPGVQQSDGALELSERRGIHARLLPDDEALPAVLEPLHGRPCVAGAPGKKQKEGSKTSDNSSFRPKTQRRKERM